MTTGFGFESTTDEVLDGVDLTGRTVVVTGATSGLGLETARALASRGADVTITGRSQEKLDDAAAQLRDMGLPGAITTTVLELGDLESVRSCAKELLSTLDRIDVLVNNAGVMVCPLGRTAQGFETQFGTNYLGHFLLTGLLAPLLVAAAPSRVVNLASSGHRLADLDLDDPNWESRDYDRWGAYGGSKTANVLFSVGLDARLKDKGVRSYAVHPGMIMTPLARHMVPEDMEILGGGTEEFKEVPQGAATTVLAATSPALADTGGVYLADCQVADVDDSDAVSRGVRSYAIDRTRADRLWTESEALVGQTFSF
ncbi:MAG: SDR family NAD(P)-dependent oxidoreductase [Microthrixaceae bacterium]